MTKDIYNSAFLAGYEAGTRKIAFTSGRASEIARSIMGHAQENPGAYIGGAIGGVGGAAIGAASGSRGKRLGRAILGSILGGGAGAGVGHGIDRSRGPRPRRALDTTTGSPGIPAMGEAGLRPPLITSSSAPDIYSPGGSLPGQPGIPPVDMGARTRTVPGGSRAPSISSGDLVVGNQGGGFDLSSDSADLYGGGSIMSDDMSAQLGLAGIVPTKSMGGTKSVSDKDIAKGLMTGEKLQVKKDKEFGKSHVASIGKLNAEHARMIKDIERNKDLSPEMKEKRLESVAKQFQTLKEREGGTEDVMSGPVVRAKQRRSGEYGSVPDVVLGAEPDPFAGERFSPPRSPGASRGKKDKKGK
jgi:hypothetical protein